MPELSLETAQQYVEQFFAEPTEGTRVNETSAQFSREELCDFLRQGLDELTATVRAMSPAQLAYRLPGAPSGWDNSNDEQHFDAIEIVTHVASGIAFHWWGIARALGHERPEFPRAPEGVSTTGKNRNGLGGGGWTGVPLEEALEHLHRTADRFLSYVEALPVGPDREATSNLGVFKRLTPHSWLLLDAMHVPMHIQQIRQMQGQPDYPAA